MPDEPDLAGLEAERARLYADLSQVGDFRRGALNAVRRAARLFLEKVRIDGPGLYGSPSG